MTSIETELPFFVKYSLKQIIGVPNTFTLTGDKRNTWAYGSLTSAFSFTSSIGTVLMYLLSSVRLSSHIWRVLQLFSFFNLVFLIMLYQTTNFWHNLPTVWIQNHEFMQTDWPNLGLFNFLHKVIQFGDHIIFYRTKKKSKENNQG